MIVAFDDNAFLHTNIDIKNEINKHKNMSEYLNKNGLKDIQVGKVKFHHAFEVFNEEYYLETFSDVRDAIKKGSFSSGFEHFCLYGYQEIILNDRVWNKIYGHIDKFTNNTIEGWAGKGEDSNIEVEIYINDIHLDTIIASIDREDLQTHQVYKYCKGFIYYIDIAKYVQLFDSNMLDELIVNIKVNNQILEIDFNFSKAIWLKQIAKDFSQNNFLSQIELFNVGLDEYLGVEQLIDALVWLDDFGVKSHFITIRNKIIFTLNHAKIEYGEMYVKLHAFLFKYQDILLELSKGLYEVDNSILFTLVNQVLNDINCHDASQIIQNITIDRENIFIDDKIKKNIEDDETIAYLVNHPQEIFETWEGFDKKLRLEKALSFINLLVFLQEFDKLQYLELTLDELDELLAIDNKLAIEAIPKYLFENHQAWNGFLLTFYFISSGLKKEVLLDFTFTFIKNIDKNTYINTPAIQWIFHTKIFNNKHISFEDIKDLMQKITLFFDNKLLLEDKFIRELYQEYLILLLKNRDSEFENIYKLCLNHYLLNPYFIIDENYLNSKYLVPHQLLWIQDIELTRKILISELNDFRKVYSVLDALDKLSYLAIDSIKKIKFEFFNNILNLSEDKNLLQIARNGLMQIGGAYDKLRISEKNNTNEQDYYESLLVYNTIKWKENSFNNYWYKKALSLRASISSRRKEFLEELYKHIQKFQQVSEDEIRLIRLFYSELIISIEKGLDIETTFLCNIKIETILEKLSDTVIDVKNYTNIFNTYLQLKNIKVAKSIYFRELINEHFDLESRGMLKEILKLSHSNKIATDEAKKYIKQAMIYPYCVVMIYSCQAYIPTRQKFIRETWLHRLKELEIDYFFVVGANEISVIKEDMMYLAIEDTYEKLPQKSVEMFRFASETFSYEHFLKIDDDCFLNVDAYFSDNALFNAEYYGRYLERSIGSMDRSWHQKKSQSNSAKSSLDLSPEPSFYADGSTGYVLSRFACDKLIDAYNKNKNKGLIEKSFMEDKLVGDLLISEGVKVNSINFTASIYRKVTNFYEATFWEYNIFPHRDNRVKILHCETSATMRNVWQNFMSKNDLSTQKRYFSNVPLNSLSLNTPYLEEVDVKYSLLSDAYHIAIIVCKNEFNYLEKSLEHHRALGIEHFIYIDNASDDGSLEFMLLQEDTSVFITTQPYKDHHFSINWVEVALSNFCIGKWVLVIDSDELFIYDNFESQPIQVLSSYGDTNGYDSFLAPMIDMYNKDTLASAKLEDDIFYKVCNYFDNISTMGILEKESFGPYANSGIYFSGLRDRIFGSYNIAPVTSYINQKFCLFKYQPTHKIREGLHFMYNNKPAPLKVALLHFKYHAGFHAKVLAQIESGQHWNGSQEYKRYLNTLKENEELSLYDEKISLKFESSHSLIQAGYMDKIL